MSKSKIRVFETFAGIGAQHKALEILKKQDFLDYEVVATSEWDIWANISYNAIHHNNKNIAKPLKDKELNDFFDKFDLSNDSKKVADKMFVKRLPRTTKEILYSSMVNSNNLGSILNITGESLINSITKESTKNSYQTGVDLITYSFPCQDLSTAGNFHNSNKGMKKGSGTRSGLLWEIERILRELKVLNQLPKYLLLENVRNMLSNKHIDDYREWLSFLHDELGYNTQTYQLNAKDYDSPQARTRVYALSVLGEDDQNFHDSFAKNNRVIEVETIPKNVSSQLKIKKKLHQVLKTDYTKQEYLEEASKATPNLTPSRVKMYCENPILHLSNISEAKYQSQYQKIGSNGYYMNYSRTVTTKQDRNPNSGMISIENSLLIKEHENNPLKKNMHYRLLTPRETYLLMGFEEKDVKKIFENDFISQAVRYRQAGNSIVVNVLVAIFKKVAELEYKEEE
ncbi:DNA (cytosine-5-)-methyltransferase [Mesoplasma seiffertii]|uniref:DNA (cytosine-5-)-methyltransferase n=1 Tax=Mesoplasma seiffertii TaxID=28224 RepID=UPI000687B2DA|nr:DNA (cytosine-5-)-methyltransferase [Mesoplasma seiffertii]